ncbi:branched-chain amino acid ABC transporter ATP-binding protein/permease [Oceanibaculum pacificum]|uniref:branched-chain amino acid ABC transporter ATP-binding protein/permease n=1 Tax=Oceanibaculum pacificum TaxID=580166 RepID=UPI000A0394EB|nr:branched-chain amino acid ABC transporter ATP-binding protein/permease [Oceanibaculum pacificum]
MRASKPLGLLAAGLGWPLAVALSAYSDGYQAYVIGLIGLTTIVAVGLNVLMGLAGQISIGQIAFYAIGAYAVGILTAMEYGLPFGLAVPLGALLAGGAGLLLALPAMRLSGPYLAMVTIAFAFVVEHSLIEARGLTGGANGLLGTPPILPVVGMATPQHLAVLIVTLTALSLLGFWALKASRWGLAMQAVSGSEVAAASLGLNPLWVKTVAFGLAAGFAGMAGGFFTPMAGFISPESFPLLTSIIFVLVVMIGGTGTVLGPLAGSLIVVLIPEMLSNLAEYRLLLVGFLLLVVLLIAPGGVVGELGRLFRRVQPAAPVNATALDLAAFLAGEPGGGLKIRGLTVAFGGVKAVTDVSFEARPGQVTSLIGPNGAGKTTALNLICGFYVPNAGQVMLGGRNVAGWRNHRIARQRLARTFQTTQLFGNLSVLDNLLIAFPRGALGLPFLPLRLTPSGSRQIAEAWALLAYVGYRGRLDVATQDLPHVDRRLVEIARALAMKPDMLLLDEPAAGLSHADTRKVGQLIRQIADAGVTVLIVEHDMDLVMGISDHVVVLDAGQVIAAGPPAAIERDPRVQQAYLGTGATVDLGRLSAWRADRDALLNVAKLTAGYGAAPVIEDISFAVHSGEMVAILGANGAGKTTLMAALSGLLPASGGTVEFLGDSLAGAGAAEIARKGLILVPEGRQVFPELTVMDNLALGAFARRARPDAAELEAILDRFPRLRERAGSRAGLLSGGEQQMLAIGRGLMARPRILLLDEPSLGLAPNLVERLYRDLATLRDEGMTILLVDQMAAMALTVVDRALVLENGRIVKAGSAEELRNDPTLAEAYLGGGRDRDPSPQPESAHAAAVAGTRH